MQWKRIPLQEYTNFMQLTSEVEKYQNTVKELQKKIESKNLQLDEMQRTQQRIHNEWIDVSKLSTVSVSWYMMLMCSSSYQGVKIIFAN